MACQRCAVSEHQCEATVELTAILSAGKKKKKKNHFFNKNTITPITYLEALQKCLCLIPGNHIHRSIFLVLSHHKHNENIVIKQKKNEDHEKPNTKFSW